MAYSDTAHDRYFEQIENEYLREMEEEDDEAQD